MDSQARPLNKRHHHRRVTLARRLSYLVIISVPLALVSWLYIGLFSVVNPQCNTSNCDGFTFWVILAVAIGLLILSALLFVVGSVASLYHIHKTDQIFVLKAKQLFIWLGRRFSAWPFSLDTASYWLLSAIPIFIAMLFILVFSGDILEATISPPQQCFSSEFRPTLCHTVEWGNVFIGNFYGVTFMLTVFFLLVGGLATLLRKIREHHFWSGRLDDFERAILWNFGIILLLSALFFFTQLLIYAS